MLNLLSGLKFRSQIQETKFFIGEEVELTKGFKNSLAFDTYT